MGWVAGANSPVVKATIPMTYANDLVVEFAVSMTYVNE